MFRQDAILDLAFQALADPSRRAMVDRLVRDSWALDVKKGIAGNPLLAGYRQVIPRRIPFQIFHRKPLHDKALRLERRSGGFR